MVKRCCLLGEDMFAHDGKGDDTIIELLNAGDGGRVRVYCGSASKQGPVGGAGVAPRTSTVTPVIGFVVASCSDVVEGKCRCDGRKDSCTKEDKDSASR
jgi:hypothetical protein